MKVERHLGKLKSSNADIVTVFMQLPERPDHSLIVNINTMSGNHRSDLMNVVMSPLGQDHPILAEALHKNKLSSGETILEMLHRHKYLRAVPVADVIMCPSKSVSFPLAEIIATGQLNPKTSPSSSQSLAPRQVAQPVPETDAPQSLLANVEDNFVIANRLLSEAAQLRTDALLKEQNAYALAPELAPLPELQYEPTGAYVSESLPVDAHLPEDTKAKGRKKIPTQD